MDREPFIPWQLAEILSQLFNSHSLFFFFSVSIGCELKDTTLASPDGRKLCTEHLRRFLKEASDSCSAFFCLSSFLLLPWNVEILAGAPAASKHQETVLTMEAIQKG